PAMGESVMPAARAASRSAAGALAESGTSTMILLVRVKPGVGPSAFPDLSARPLLRRRAPERLAFLSATWKGSMVGPPAHVGMAMTAGVGGGVLRTGRP